MNGIFEITSRLQRHISRLETSAENVTKELARHSYEKALRLVPVRTGTLRASIRCEGNRVFTRCPYAKAVENGTFARPAQPFMRPSADERLFFRRGEEVGKEAVT